MKYREALHRRNLRKGSLQVDHRMLTPRYQDLRAGGRSQPAKPNVGISDTEP